MQRSALCRSRRELSNEYLFAQFGFDTAENEPFKFCPLSVYRFPRLQLLHYELIVSFEILRNFFRALKFVADVSQDGTSRQDWGARTLYLEKNLILIADAVRDLSHKAIAFIFHSQCTASSKFHASQLSWQQASYI